MKLLSGVIIIVCSLCVSARGAAQSSSAPDATAPSNTESMSHLSRSAADELARSIQTLNELREEIAREKLPLAGELTAAEERVVELRKEFERVTRLIDAGNLELPTIKAESKARQDELTYVGNLLDEYAKTFASKVHISELQYCGEAIKSATDAAANTTLSPSERFTRQIDFVNVSVERLFDVVGGMRFPGVAVDGEGSVANGQFAIIGPIALFATSSGGTAGLVIPQTGSVNPLIRPLEGPMQAGIASIVGTGQGMLPLDPSLGGALKALIQKTNLMHIFEKGGPIMWPLLFASVLALGTVLERLLFLMIERWRRDPKAMERFFTAVSHGHLDEAVRISKGSKFYVLRALGYALAHREGSLENALLYAQGQELKRFRRGVPILDTVITLAPLLGLLGTVVGMMGSFSLIGGDLDSPGAITGGIAEALIATAFGLGIAITALLPFNFMNARLEDARHEIESASTQLELLVRPRLDVAHASVIADTKPMSTRHFELLPS
ncbi:MAG: MotA/TolQ/ExbB proton channel family protein [Phycisphaerae bacterium]|nr:MotA/TolQ/ExbB proton channel family protein [Phycisphaerae bacterium]